MKKSNNKTIDPPQDSFRLSPLEHIVDIILKEVQPEKICLLYSTTYEKDGWPLHVRNMWGAYAFNIVVLVKGTNRRFEDIHANIREKYKAATPLNFNIFTVHQFKMVLKDDETLTLRYKEACVLYDVKDKARGWPESAKFCVKDNWLVRMREDIEMYYYMGLDFLKNAQAHLKAKSYRVAALSLHQCMEYFMAGLNLMVTGYRASVHNINELHRFAAAFLPEASTILPHHHGRQQRIHQIIYRAYVAKTEPIPVAELFALVAELNNVNKTLRGLLIGYDR
ncbi:HEPN domain-containing protein [Paraflavitalea sp. CAU 1676]|uniref:HEPN domain-containing protein n=1 Tax=Paraflavitalea sp. CAU 1676 TaxID=3032598 RepID=UPI0023DC9A2D|nr:HEPN domain-containing protein [Paraflavitalea sp. CAU 1676]MDF2191386.1 HEPN domain-containing protein [Paraflavitalea sp. CAU 1676]